MPYSLLETPHLLLGIHRFQPGMPHFLSKSPQPFHTGQQRAIDLERMLLAIDHNRSLTQAVEVALLAYLAGPVSFVEFGPDATVFLVEPNISYRRNASVPHNLSISIVLAA